MWIETELYLKQNGLGRESKVSGFDIADSCICYKAQSKPFCYLNSDLRHLYLGSIG